MGGPGSGYRIDKKQTVEESIPLDAGELVSQQFIGPARTAGRLYWRYRGSSVIQGWADYTAAPVDERRRVLTLTYQISVQGVRRQVAQPVYLESTRPHFGGQRWWLLCPACQRRMSTLYLPSGAALFACRRCHRLVYRSWQSYDSRVSALIRRPEALQAAQIGKPTISMLTLKALAVLEKRRERDR